MNKYIPYSHQHISKSDISEVVKVLKSDFITQGPKIHEFEKALCKYTGAKYAVVVSSGTAALHIACLAIGIKSGDEVITSPISFAASGNCVLYCGGNVIFSDIQNDTVNIDPKKVIKKINKKTKAIIPVHFAGHPCDMEEIFKIAKENKLIVIEDAAHALGASFRSKKIGACDFSDMTILSFHPVKSITTGEGGAVLTNNKSLYDRLLIFRNHGITKDPDRLINKKKGADWYYEMQELGHNYRMTDIQAALGISQLKKLDSFIDSRRKIVKQYNEAFRNNPYFDIPVERSYVESASHLYPIRLKGKYNVLMRRIKVFAYLKKKGIGVQVHYIPMYWHSYYRKVGISGNCPNAEDYYARAISIPVYPSMNKSSIEYVISTLKKLTIKMR